MVPFVPLVSGKTRNCFWAIRGGGPGLFCVVTRFHLRTYQRPEIFAYSWTYSFRDLIKVADALVEVAPHLKGDFDLSASVVRASNGGSRDGDPSDSDRVVTIDATVYATDRHAADRGLGALLGHPITQRAVEHDPVQAVSLESLYSADELTFSQRRFAVDNIYTNRLHEWQKSCSMPSPKVLLLTPRRYSFTREAPDCRMLHVP